MKLRFALLAVPAAIALAACSSSGGSSDNTSTPAAAPSTPSTSTTVVTTTPASSPAAAADPYCAKLATFPQMLAQFQTELAAPKAADLKKDVASAVTYFKGLEVGAPAALAPQLKTVVTTLQGVKSVNDIPKLTPMVVPVATALQTWITTNCTAS